MTRSDIRNRFAVSLIAAAMHDWGYSTLGDMAKDYGLREIYEMLEKYERIRDGAP